KSTVIAASLPGYGPAWIGYDELKPQQPFRLQLVEDLPVHGRIIDLEGRPIPNVPIKIGHPRGAENDKDLSDWLAGVKAGEFANTIWQKAPRQIESRLIGLPDTVTTDTQGTFEIRALGKERFVEISLGDENVAHRDAYVVTRQMDTLQKTVGLPRFSGTTPVFGADFTFTAYPSRTVEGV